jgi:phosphate transport system permease protein
MRQLWRRKLTNAVMVGSCGAAVLVACLPLLSLAWGVIARGAAGLSWDFFTSSPAPVGEPGGGIGNALVGTMELVALSCVLAFPFGIGAGVFLAEGTETKLASVVRFTAEVLSGVPSIVVGIVAYGLVVMPMKRFSALAGAVALAILMIPTLARTTEELVRRVPPALREASLALGVPRWKTSLRIVLRTALSGIATGALLAIARAAGETAPLLFTALNNQYWSFRPDQPIGSLTVQIFNYAISPYEEWRAKAWSAALVLLMFVAGLNLLARTLTRNRMGVAR